MTQVSSGQGFTIFVKSDGSLWGMGDNSYGQLGQGFSLSQTNLPVEIVNSNVTSIVAGYYHTLFTQSNGSLWAMGSNGFGQLGDGTTANHYFPEEIVSNGVTGIAAGGFHSLFTSITFDRFIEIWNFSGMGLNDDGELGNGTTTSYDSPEEIQSSTMSEDSAATIACGEYHSLYVSENGSLWAAGDNASGQLGDGGTDLYHDSFEEIVSSGVTAVAAGTAHSLFIKSGGGLWAMGDDSQGELGDNSTNQEDSPEQVGVNVTAVAAGDNFSLFIESDGSLWGMGANGLSQLGDGTTLERHIPEQIVASNVVAVAAGGNQSFFIKSDGTLWAMGANFDGQLGDGTTTFPRLYPVQIVPLVIPQTTITGISLANTNIVLGGSNGQTGRSYYTLMSTNLALPLNQWMSVATNFLLEGGNFNFTVPKPNAPQAFYVLQAVP